MSSHNERSSSRARMKPKPILRKLNKNEARSSLDLDRVTDDPTGLGIWEEHGAGSRTSYDTYRDFSRRGYHARSTSGTSQFSTATSVGSLPRTGSFVHPFQQTPRPYTPPLASSYQDSLRESVHSKESPALTEDEDAVRQPYHRSASNLSNTSPLITQTTTATSTTISQPLQMQPTRSNTSRLVLSTSHNDFDSSPIASQDTNTTPVDTMSPMSYVRSSMDKGFRIRSKSEVDERVRAETIQEARRKFYEKEAKKEEKAAREEIRAREKREEREAREIEKRHRQSSASEATRSKRSRSDPATMEKTESELLGRDYNTVRVQTPPRTTETPAETMERPRRSMTVARTKKKTHSTWTKFMIWLRTRFIRIGRKMGS